MFSHTQLHAHYPQVYKSSKSPCNEESPIKPWTKHATYKHQAEEALRAIDGLPLVVLRLALVYGNGDVAGLMPRVVIAAAYKQLGETMKVREMHSIFNQHMHS